jgi:hypothetical protein
LFRACSEVALLSDRLLKGFLCCLHTNASCGLRVVFEFFCSCVFQLQNH